MYLPHFYLFGRLVLVISPCLKMAYHSKIRTKNEQISLNRTMVIADTFAVIQYNQNTGQGFS